MCISSFPKIMTRTAMAAVVAAGLAISAKVESAQAKDWVGPAIAGAIVGGIIANQVWRNNGYRYGYNRHYGAPYPYRKRVQYRRYNPYPPVYYRPAVVIPLPFFVVRPGW